MKDKECFLTRIIHMTKVSDVDNLIYIASKSRITAWVTRNMTEISTKECGQCV